MRLLAIHHALMLDRPVAAPVADRGEGVVRDRARDRPSFDPEPRPRLKEAIWVEPAIVVEVEFTEWTGVGILRHPSYKGQRTDVDPREVVREVGNSANA